MSTRVETFPIGRWKAHAILAGLQRLDGGAMFGVVPRTLWERKIPADDRHRIGLAMRSLLLEHDDGLILIETGLGNKENEKFLGIYGIENAGADGRTWLEDGLASLGYGTADISRVICTHLHFDHAGGSTFVAPDDPERRPQPTFPRAIHTFHRGELEYATHTNERTQASYFPANWEPVIDAGLAEFIDGNENTIVPGIVAMTAPGHTPWHQVIRIENQGETVVFVADLVPTAHHLPLPWIMGYDVEPLRTLESRRSLYARGIAEGWQLFFTHDADTVRGRLVEGEKGIALAEEVRVNFFPAEAASAPVRSE